MTVRLVFYECCTSRDPDDKHSDAACSRLAQYMIEVKDLRADNATLREALQGIAYDSIEPYTTIARAALAKGGGE